MQKYIKNDGTGYPRYFDDHVYVHDWIDLNEYRLMTESEILKHESQKPTEFHTVWDEENAVWVDSRTEEEVAEYEREQMPDLSPIQFEWKLEKVGLLTTIKNYIETTENTLIKIAYNRAIYFKRTDPILIQAMTDLGLTAKQVDHIWLNV